MTTKADAASDIDRSARAKSFGAAASVYERARPSYPNAAVDWLRKHLVAGDVVLVKASRGAHLDEVAAALA